MITTVFLFVVMIIGGVKDVDRFAMPSIEACYVERDAIIEESSTITTITYPDGTVNQTVKPNGTFIVFCGEKTRKCHKWEVCP